MAGPKTITANFGPYSISSGCHLPAAVDGIGIERDVHGSVYAQPRVEPALSRNIFYFCRHRTLSRTRREVRV
jgi:hypothetical protein